MSCPHCQRKGATEPSSSPVAAPLGSVAAPLGSAAAPHSFVAAPLGSVAAPRSSGVPPHSPGVPPHSSGVLPHSPAASSHGLAIPPHTSDAPCVALQGPLTPTQPPRKHFFRSGARKTGWLLPGILLVLMPKCPICLAAYIALVTGITIPITAATWLRLSLIAICIAAIVWLAVRSSLYLYRRTIQ